MVETTIDIRLLPTGQECVIASDAAGEVREQAELVAFGHTAARLVSLLAPAQSGEVVNALLAAEGKRNSAPAAAIDEAHARARVRFLDGASSPRMDFRLKLRGELAAGASVSLLFETLAQRYRDVELFHPRLTRVAELVGRLGATGQITRQNEFDIALAAADVAWRAGLENEPPRADPHACPACGNTDAFEFRLWPSTEGLLRKCAQCGAGVWARDGHRPRLLRADVWSAMEAMRAELGGDGAVSPSDDGDRSLYGELKRVFAENGWPYAEVDGAPVLVSELSGPAGRWDFYAQALEDRGLVLLYSIAPEAIPEERRLHVSEFLTRANYGLADGNFELDFDDGELRFKTVLHAGGDELDSLLLRRLVRANGVALETYLPTIAELIGGEVSAESGLNSG
jgi:hypothetical protein